MNCTVVGSGIDTFAEVVERMAKREFLWSCLCDKKGDWAVSAQDDVSAEELKVLLSGLDVTILPVGELVFMIEDVLRVHDLDVLEAWDCAENANA